jgi:hypothetical protein
MKISYILDFDNPDADFEQLTYEKFCLNNAEHFAQVIKNYNIHLRNIIKYQDDEYTSEQIETVKRLRATFIDLLEDCDSSFLY